ncbi:adhesion G protein-coupled receptor E3-like [Paramisgurnus dabryanus]|uniref:adhesion G protein-coupled receptor E3-like n=1 Tax=Paramisgurnus dabryanus TaxID=90735 RepID=UPI003CCFD4A7
MGAERYVSRKGRHQTHAVPTSEDDCHTSRSQRQTKRPKRFLGALLGAAAAVGTLFNIGVTSVNAVSLATVRRHVNEIQEEIPQLREQLTAQSKSLQTMGKSLKDTVVILNTHSVELKQTVNSLKQIFSVLQVDHAYSQLVTALMSDMLREVSSSVDSLAMGRIPPYLIPLSLNQSTGCLTNLLDQIDSITVKELPLNNVTNLLELVFNTSMKILPSLSADPQKLVSDGNRVLKVSENLVSMLVKPTDNCNNVNLTLDTVEAQVFMVGPHVTLVKIPQLDTTNASLDIDLIGIAKNNPGIESAAVAFMSYNTMENLLKPDFFNTSNDTVKTMMSTVISATLPKTPVRNLIKPVNFTFKHIREFVSEGNLSCVYWNMTEWTEYGCSVVQSNSSHTVCSCLHLSTFALIMQISSRTSQDDSRMELVNLVFVIVGLVFTSLALLTFAFCRWKPGVNNVARINLCISLLSAHLLFLLTQRFLTLIKPHEELCAVISGALHFLFLSCFVWMFIEAVLLFICVKNLSQISCKQRAVLSSRFLIVIGYSIAFVIVGVSVGLVPEGYGSEQCWIKQENGFIWSFLGPVCFILAINTILFISIIISMRSTITKLNAKVSQIKQTKIMAFKTLAQFVIIGCPWILGFFTDNNKMMEILFLILNSQQGTFIFLIHCVLSHEVRQQYVKWMKAVF